MNCPRLSGRQKLASSARHVPSPESVVVFFATSLPNGQSLSREPQNTVSCISITLGIPRFARSLASKSRSSPAFLAKSRAQLGLVVAVVSLIPSHAEAHRRTSQPTITTPTQRVSRWETK